MNLFPLCTASVWPTKSGVIVLRRADFADRGEALAAPHPHFGRAEPERDVVALFRYDLRARARTTAQLTAAADLQLDVVHRGAEGNLEQRHRIAGADVGAGTGNHAVADVQAFRCQDVALLAVAVMQQRDARRPVRIVFDARDARRNSELVAPKIDAPVLPLVPAAHIPARDVALVVAPACPLPRLQPRLLRPRLRDFRGGRDRAETRGR